MNRWQMARQIKHVLQAAQWPGGTEPVFGRVLVTLGADVDTIQSAQWPIVRIRPGSFEVDPEHSMESKLIRGRFELQVHQQVSGDGEGEGQLIGGHRNAITSDGRGMLEIEERIFAAASQLDGDDGISAQVVAASAADITYDDDVGYVAFVSYLVEVLTSSTRTYPGPDRFTGSDAGGQTASLSWRPPPDRYDRYRIRLFRGGSAGDPAPGSVSSGVEVALPANIVSAATVALPGAGVWGFSLFTTYDEDDTYDGAADSDDQTSDPTQRTITVA